MANAAAGFSVKTTWCGMLLLQDRGIINGFHPQITDKRSLVDITEAVRKKGMETFEQAEEWVLHTAEHHGFNGVNAAYTISVEAVKEEGISPE